MCAASERQEDAVPSHGGDLSTDDAAPVAMPATPPTAVVESTLSDTAMGMRTPSFPKQSRPQNPMKSASLLSRLFFLWPYPLLKLGMERPLNDGDIYDLMEQDTSEYNLGYFRRLWDESLHEGHKRKRRNLHKALLKDFFRSLWFIQPMELVGHSARVAQAVFLGLLVEYFQGRNASGYLWASLLVICGLILVFEHHHVFFFTWRAGMRFRVACVAAIYDKSLRLSSTHSDTSSSYGRIMNLASNDVERFIMATLFCNHLVWGPVQSVGILIVGCLLVGYAFAAGFAMLILIFVPLQFYLSGKFAYYRSKIAAITDQRVTFVSQAVRGARVMKMSGYEWRFLQRIQDYRRQEIHQIEKANTLKALNEALFFVTNVVISLVIFLVHVGYGGTLRPGDVFTVFTLINILQLEMTKHVSLGVMGVSECFVSVSRIQRFLEFPELSTARKDLRNDQDNSITNDCDDVLISLSRARSYWNDVTVSTGSNATSATTTDDEDDEHDIDDNSASSLLLALDNVSVDFRRGELTAIIGAVGQGKSALVQAIVGELPVSSGSMIRHYRSLAYAAQDPWIMDGTIRDNILMGLDYQPDWYDHVVRACCLLPDFGQFRDGDQTIVGDRGVQCSGGQRARIGLARAIYRDADLLVVDDPLSAVDSKVGRQLYQDALIGLGVNKGKCVILATHQHQYVHDCRCVLVSAGRVDCVGTYEDCVVASKGKLLVHAADDKYVDSLNAGEKETSGSNADPYDDDGGNLTITYDQEASDDTKEMSNQGIVRFETYKNYLKAMGGVRVGVFLLVLFTATQSSVLVTIAYIGQWAKRPNEKQDYWDIMGLVIGLGVVVIMLALLRAFYSFRLAIKASKALHDRMSSSVLRAKIEFFDTNPLGRIMNRFSADVGSNDDLLPTTLFDFSVIAFVVIGALVTTIVTLPVTLVVFPPLLWYFVSVRRIFVTSSRELKRLEGLARSPIFAMVSESLGGIAVIRANDAVSFFQRKFQLAHDAHTRAFFAFISASRWVGFRMDFLMFSFLALASYLAVLVQDRGWFQVDPTTLGLSLAMLLQLAGMFQWCVRQSAEVVNQMVSVERVLAFGDLAPEAPLECSCDQELMSSPSTSDVPSELPWPSKGSIEFQDVSVRYRPTLPLALNAVSFAIPASSRVGVVGRTGSGKSTIVQTLFRLLEAESGQVLIDGVDVSRIGLHTLRTRMSVLPQVPTLFSGCTVRENLDPFALSGDEQIRQVLEDCHLWDVIQDLPSGWNSLVSENGSNFSVGQRQLLCLARALLSRNSILVLDEATASVDRRTDQLLQETLRKTFSHGTILAVAHRLDTVIDYDFILVLGKGHVLEFGPPAELLRRTGGHFASMVADTGDTMSRELRRLAFQKEETSASPAICDIGWRPFEENV
jgi:ATP-binding cassette subfamily C (CFTR/MRP) protein 4